MTKELGSKAVIALLAGCLGILAGAGPAAAQGVLDANCPGPPNTVIGAPGDHRFAQTFAPQVTGGLVRGEIEINKFGTPGGTG